MPVSVADHQHLAVCGKAGALLRGERRGKPRQRVAVDERRLRADLAHLRRGVDPILEHDDPILRRIGRRLRSRDAGRRQQPEHHQRGSKDPQSDGRQPWTWRTHET
jgi:hypothetical protein